jgi:hypothetical protein
MYRATEPRFQEPKCSNDPDYEVAEVMLGKVMHLIWSKLSVFNEPGHPFSGALVSSRYDAVLINKKRDQLIAIPSLRAYRLVCVLATTATCPAHRHIKLTSYVTKYVDMAQFQCTKLNSVVLVRKRTIPTERPQPVGEVSANVR